ncbi:MAG: bifunctional tetrahydrofolate synthase/dihydrofolate synthase [Marinobacter sp.]
MKPPSTEHKPASPEAGATVDQWLQWLEAIHPTEIDLGLDRVLVVLRRLFPRKPSARIVTVAGTNGKGTTVATVDRLLRTAGRSTGAYTSPHLQRYNERVRVNGQDITDAALVSAFERVEAARGKVSLTYFEFGTLAAFVAFADAGVEDWILEVGLGGRLDAVNVLDADYAVITSIDIDHVGFLGDNRDVIGFEKAGILRRGIFAVCADPEPPSSVLQQAAAQKVDLRVTGRDYRIEPDITDSSTVNLILASERIALPAGPLPVESVAAGVVLARILEPELSVDRVSDAVRSLTVAGRFEQLRSSPDVILDVGHNPHAARWLAGKLARRKSSPGQIFGVYAALAHKDIAGVLAATAPVVDRWWFAGLSVARGLHENVLVARASECGIGQYRACASVADALRAAMAEATATDTIIVFGSFYTVAQARELLGAGVS